MLTLQRPKQDRFCSAQENFFKCCDANANANANELFSAHTGIEFESEEKNREIQPSAVDKSAELHATPGKNFLVTFYMFTAYVIIFLPNFTFLGYARLNKYICASNENP